MQTVREVHITCGTTGYIQLTPNLGLVGQTFYISNFSANKIYPYVGTGNFIMGNGVGSTQNGFYLSFSISKLTMGTIKYLGPISNGNGTGSPLFNLVSVV